MIAPLTSMSIRGWLWYQGEYNLQTNAVSGNSLGGYGYGCELPKLVSAWRAKWSRVPNTTDPLAPFGVVTLAENAHWHGGRDLGGMRHAQTANFGSLPNDAMPNTFLAQAYDIHDPWGDERCLGWGCCEHHSLPPSRLPPDLSGLSASAACANRTALLGGALDLASRIEVPSAA